MARPPSPAAGRTIIDASWGSGEGQLGRHREREGNAEAPMSLSVAADGSVAVLDQINGRVVRYGRDGRVSSTVSLALRAPQDVVALRDGSYALLDRLGDRTVALLDANGRERGRFDLLGRGITEGGAVTGLVVNGNDVYVEREHGPLVRVGNTNGQPDPEREEVPGRPTRDGQAYISAGIVEAAAGRLFVNVVNRPSLQHRYTRALQMNAPIASILMLDSDLQGTIYLAVALLGAAAVDDAGEATPSAGTVRLVCLEALHGTPVGQAALPVNDSPDETFRELVALDEGGVLYAVRSEQGLRVQRFDCR